MCVWMCSGQGAQKPGMGADLLGLSRVAEAFEVASQAMELDLVELVRSGTAEQVDEPVTAQALTMAISVGVGKELMDRDIHPDALVGFSLGQISALALADVLSLEDAFLLLRVRANALADACHEREGAMAALLGASHEDAQAVCASCAGDDVLVCANFNAPGQVVVSGDAAAVDRAQSHWKDQGGKSARLNTAGAFHSPLMQGASHALRAYCEGIAEDGRFRDPEFQVLCNTDARPFEHGAAVDRLASQVASPVLFEQSVSRLIAEGHDDFVEVGFGGVLFNLVKRIDRSVDRHRVGTLDQFEEFVAQSKESADE